MQPIRPAADNTRLFESRSTESSSSQETKRNHLYAFTLSDLLDKRKSTETEKDLGKLAKDFGIEPDRLKRLGRFINSPSINSLTIRPASGKSEEEGFIATAVWVEPKISG
ncbi:hypothetical protein CPB84DRAFT_1770983 [Gymnopilus junonius]|uniref:Uncharacterized protein n=1 Tax=Gymnopilus junonius TaxID=109634 RepID=A0A9P5TQW8_GYMJU|nr:hypothetical protein CPB84DRAFT_1770983 [Gymnopilus junonius]